MKNSLRKGLVKFTTAIISQRTNFKLDGKRIAPGCFKVVEQQNKAGKFSIMFTLSTEAELATSRTEDLGSHRHPSSQKKVDFEFDKILFAIVNDKQNTYQKLLRDLGIAQAIPQVYFTDKKTSGDLGPVEFQKIQQTLGGLAINLQKVKDFSGKLGVRKTLVQAFEVIDCYAPKGSSNKETDFRVSKVTDYTTSSIDFEFVNKKKWEQCGVKMFSLLQMYSNSFTIDQNARKITFQFPEHDLQNNDGKRTSSSASGNGDGSNGAAQVVVQPAPKPFTKKDPTGDRILAMVSDMEGLPEDMLKVIHMLVESFSIQVRLVKEEKNKLAARLSGLKTVDEFWTLLKKNDLHVIKGQKHEIVDDRALFTVLTEELKPLDKEQLQGYFSNK